MARADRPLSRYAIRLDDAKPTPKRRLLCVLNQHEWHPAVFLEEHRELVYVCRWCSSIEIIRSP